MSTTDPHAAMTEQRLQDAVAEYQRSQEFVERAQFEVGHAENARELNRDRRDEAIRAALDARMPVASIRGVTGLSRARVYQIRDGKR